MPNHESLFVYGTLRPPHRDTPADDSRYYAHIADYVVAHQPATLAGADLYDLGSYPAATPGQGLLQGDLLTLDPAALPIADGIEGHPTFFRRQSVTVQTVDDNIDAWIYWAPPGLTKYKRRIENGDWLHRALEKEESTMPESASVADSQPTPDPVLRTLVERFATENCSWLSSVRPDGRVHTAPVWHVWAQGRAYVVTKPDAVKVKNIEANPSVVISHPDPQDPIIIEGWAIETEQMRPLLKPLFQAKYEWDITTDTEYGVVIEITPTKLIAWGQYGAGRWPGEDVMRIV